MIPLPIACAPKGDESAISYVERLATANHLPLSALLAAVAPNRVPSSWEPEDWDRLRSVSGMSESTLTAMRRPSAALTAQPDALLLLDTPLLPQQVHTRSLRICPDCISEQGRILEIWNVAHAPACARHRTLLVETCPCGKSLSVTRRGPKPMSCQCGIAFEDMIADRADPWTIAASAWFLHLLNPTNASGTHAPPPFADLRASDLAAVLDMVGLAACTKDEDDRRYASHRSGYKRGDMRNRSDVETLALHTATAAEIMSGWPERWHPVLDRIISRNTDRPGTTFATSIGRLVVKPYRDLAGDVMPCLVKALDGYCALRGIKHPNNTGLNQRSAVFRAIRQHVPKRTLAASVGERPNSVDFKLVLGETVSSMRTDPHENARSLSERFRREFARRWGEHHATVASDVASLHLDHPRIGRDMSPWIHPRLLMPCEGATERHSRRRRESFRRADVERLRSRLDELAIRIDDTGCFDGFVDYSQGIKPLYGGGYDKTRFLLDVFEGRVSVASRVDRPRLSDLLFNRGEGIDASWTVRVQIIAEEDRFWVKHRVVSLIDSLWPNRPVRTALEGRALWQAIRDGGDVRIRQMVNTSGGRSRPLYHYALIDCMRTASNLFGPCISPAVDARLST